MTAGLRTDEIFTGLSDFDALAGPIPRDRVTPRRSTLVHGHTAFALSVARHNDEEGRQVVVASFESGSSSPPDWPFSQASAPAPQPLPYRTTASCFTRYSTTPPQPLPP